jgi:hypothetical protein
MFPTTAITGDLEIFEYTILIRILVMPYSLFQITRRYISLLIFIFTYSLPSCLLLLREIQSETQLDVSAYGRFCK